LPKVPAGPGRGGDHRAPHGVEGRRMQDDGRPIDANQDDKHVR